MRTSTELEASIARHPAGKAKQDSEFNIDAELDSLEAWLNEYDQVRAELDAKRAQREAQAEVDRHAREAERLRLMGLGE